MTNKPESRKDEIMAVLKKHQTHGSWGLTGVDTKQWNAVATEIKKIFEGKVEYVLEYHNGVNWGVYSHNHETIDMPRETQKRLKENSPEYKTRLIKRTTTDQIIS